MKRKGLLAVVLALAVSFLSGCNTSKDFDITFSPLTPDAYVGEEYDLEPFIEKENGVSYSLKVYCQDIYNYPNETEVPCDGFKFTPNTTRDLSCVVKAVRGNESITKTKNLKCIQRGHPIDELLASGGYSGYADSGMNKELQTNPLYIKSGRTTSLNCFYHGNNVFTWGCTFLCLQNFRLLEYWTDKTWEDAIITCWVYNPNSADLKFQMRIVDNLTKDIDLDWGQEGNIEQVVPSLQWKQIFFPLRPMGIEHTLFENESGSRKDACVIKVRYEGAPTKKPTPIYNFSLFIDGVDVVPSSMYPEIDTRVLDKKEKILFNGWSDDGLYKTPNYDTDYIKEGRSSIKYDFSSSNKYDYGAALQCPNAKSLLKYWTDKNWTNPVLIFWIYNPTDYNFKFALRIKNDEGDIDLDWGHEDMQYREAEPGVWTLVQFNLADFGINRPYYRDDSEPHRDELTIKVHWMGADYQTGKYEYTLYCDGTDIVPASSLTE